METHNKLYLQIRRNRCIGAHLVNSDTGLYLARFALDALSMGDSLICVSVPIDEKVIGKTWAICTGDDLEPVWASAWNA